MLCIIKVDLDNVHYFVDDTQEMRNKTLMKWDNDEHRVHIYIQLEDEPEIPLLDQDKDTTSICFVKEQEPGIVVSTTTDIKVVKDKVEFLRFLESAMNSIPDPRKGNKEHEELIKEKEEIEQDLGTLQQQAKQEIENNWYLFARLEDICEFKYDEKGKIDLLHSVIHVPIRKKDNDKSGGIDV